MRARLAGPLTLITTLFATAAGAVGPEGPQFLVNTETSNDQGNGEQSSCGYWKYRSHAIGSDASGDFIVVWQSEQQDGDKLGVFAQRFDADGTKAGAEFQVNQTTDESQGTPVVAVHPSGDFVVAWKGGPDIDYSGDILGRVFDASGSPAGAEFRVTNNSYEYMGNTYYVYDVRNPAVELDAAGNFVVVWEREYESDDGRDVMGRRFDASGSPLGGVFQVSDDTYTYASGFYWNRSPDVAVDSDGQFVVAWQTIKNGVGGYAVVGQRFQADGSPAGGEFQINTTGTYYGYEIASYFESTPDVKYDSTGKFLVAWSSSWVEDEGESAYYDVGARLFHGNGAPAGPQFRVNEPAVGYDLRNDGCPVVDVLSGGDFVVSWSSYGDGGALAKVRSVDSGGNPIGLDQLVNTDSDRGHAGWMPAVAAQPNDEFVVTFTDDTLDGTGGLDGFEMFAQRFSLAAGQSVSCAVQPKTDCREVTKLKQSRLIITKGSTPARSSIKWSWNKGEQTLPADLGDPFNDTSYAFCLYDGSGAAVLSAHAPHGGTCAGFACWRELTGSGPPVEYYHRQSNDDGLIRLRLGPGAEGAARLAALLKGANLDLPAQPLTGPVTAQVQSSLGECWSAEYDDFITKNDGKKFVGLSGALP
jgi:hypothetical protein